MNYLKQPFFSIGLLSLAAVGLSACGGANNAAIPQAVVTGGQPFMGVPGVAGYMGYPGYVPGANNPYYAQATTGCFPLYPNGANGVNIPFTAQGARIDNDTLKAGLIPSVNGVSLDPFKSDMPQPAGIPYGTVLFGGNIAGTASIQMASSMYFNAPGGYAISGRQQADGSLQVSLYNLMPAALSTALTTGTTTNLSGVVSISTAKATVISTLARMLGLSPTTNLVPCVSNLSFSMSYATSGGGFVFNGGYVFLYMNGSQHGFYLDL